MERILILTCIVFLFSAFSVLSAPPTKDLVLWFGFETNSKTDVKDLSGMNNHGTIKGSVNWTAKGRYGGGMEFKEGTIIVPNSDSITFEDQLTIALWINSDKVVDSYRRLVSYGWASPGSYVLGIDNHWMKMALAWDITNTVGTRFDANMDGLTVPGQWQFIAATYDGKAIKLYVDGQKKVEAAATGKINGKYDLNISFEGTDPGGGTFVGIMDEVRLYSRALSDNEIIQTMEEPPKMSVTPAEKAPITWGSVKGSY